MRILMIHQNYPGQFEHLSRALSGNAEVVAVGVGKREEARVPRVAYRAHSDRLPRGMVRSGHASLLDGEIRSGKATQRCLERLRAAGFTPDLVLAHPGWGETLFLRDVYPAAQFVAYLEYFYRGHNSDVDFDPEFPPAATALPYVRFRNVPSLMAFQEADACVTATQWQASTFPKPIRHQLLTIHDGVDTKRVAPNPAAALRLDDGTRLDRSDEIISFVSRSLEPYRGFHIFMRALPELLRRRPNARAIIVGGDDVSYGTLAGRHVTWRERLLSEVGDSIDPSRVHFWGRISYERYLTLLQLSRVHVYLTYPFVLSWSLLEAMSAGCAILASATDPVNEVITDGENGRLFPFFDVKRLVDVADELLDDAEQRNRLSGAARVTATTRYDFNTQIFPQYRSLFERLLDRHLPC